MAKIKLNLPLGEAVVTGKLVTFTAPCSCTETEAIHINGVDYTVVDALGKCVTGKYGRWEVGAVVSVILDTEKKFAFLQNGNLMADQVTVSAEVAESLGLSDATVDEALGKLSESAFYELEAEKIRDAGELWEYGGALENVSSDMKNGVYNAKTGRIAFIKNSVRVCYSDDNGETWNESTVPISSTNSAKQIAFGNDKYVVAATDGLYYSENAETWTLAPNVPTTAGSGWDGVTFGNGVFMAIERLGGVVTSIDGVTWTSKTALNINGGFITFAGGYFFAGASSYNIHRTTDGTTWERVNKHSSSDASTLKWLYSAGDYAIFCVSTSRIYYTKATDASINWREYSISEANYYRPTTALANGLFALLPCESSSQKVYVTSDFETVVEALLPTTSLCCAAGVATGDGFISISSSADKAIVSKAAYNELVTLETVAGKSLMTGLLNKLGAAKIETGSYTGVGDTSEAPIALTFGFAPVLIIIYKRGASVNFGVYSSSSTYNSQMIILPKNGSKVNPYGAYSYSRVDYAIVDKTLTINPHSSYKFQYFEYNDASVIYDYIAIG